jgi:hypothetical protein
LTGYLVAKYQKMDSKSTCMLLTIPSNMQEFSSCLWANQHHLQERLGIVGWLLLLLPPQLVRRGQRCGGLGRMDIVNPTGGGQSSGIQSTGKERYHGNVDVMLWVLLLLLVLLPPHRHQDDVDDVRHPAGPQTRHGA